MRLQMFREAFGQLPVGGDRPGTKNDVPTGYLGFLQKLLDPHFPRNNDTQIDQAIAPLWKEQKSTVGVVPVYRQALFQEHRQSV